MLLVLLALLLILFGIGAPVYLAMALGGIAALLLAGGYPLTVAVQRLYAATDDLALVAIPFFLLAGSLMDESGISARIVRLASAVIGFVRGGLSVASVGACMFFAGVTGSAVADTAAIGSIVIPPMVRKGYDRNFSAALVAAAGTIGPIIPPSIPFIVYGLIAGVSVTELFLAGVIPGLLIGLALMLLAYVTARRHGYPTEPRLRAQQIVREFLSAWPALLMPVVVLGPIITGVATATESAVMAVLYALVVGGLVYRAITPGALYRSFVRTADATAVVMFLVAASAIVSWVLTSELVPQKLASFISDLSTNRIVILALINLVFFVAGLALEVIPSMLMLVPILLPVARAVEVDPVHFGVIVVINLAIGVISPPSAPNLVVVSGISGSPLGRVSRAVIPFMLAELAVLLVVTYVPEIFMWLPLMYRR